MRRGKRTKSYSDLVLATPGLVGYWQLSERAGTVARAVVGPVASYSGSPTLGVAGLIAGDGDLAFTAASSKYATGTATTFPSGAAARTILAWYKSTNTATRQAIFHYGSDAAGETFAMEWHPGAGVGLGLTGYAADLTANNETTTVNGIPHLVGVSYDGTRARIYQDGVMLTSGLLTLNTTFTQTIFEIGAWAIQGIFATGVIDEVAIWRRRLSDGEIAEFTRVGRGF